MLSNRRTYGRQIQHDGTGRICHIEEPEVVLVEAKATFDEVLAIGVKGDRHSVMHRDVGPFAASECHSGIAEPSANFGFAISHTL